jgi:hypothetical protein
MRPWLCERGGSADPARAPVAIRSSGSTKCQVCLFAPPQLATDCAKSEQHHRPSGGLRDATVGDNDLALDAETQIVDRETRILLANQIEEHASDEIVARVGDKAEEFDSGANIRNRSQKIAIAVERRDGGASDIIEEASIKTYSSLVGAEEDGDRAVERRASGQDR